MRSSDLVFNRSRKEDQRTRMSFIQMSPLLTERNETDQQTEKDLNNVLTRTLVVDFLETDTDKDEGMFLSSSEWSVVTIIITSWTARNHCRDRSRSDRDREQVRWHFSSMTSRSEILKRECLPINKQILCVQGIVLLIILLFLND